MNEEILREWEERAFSFRDEALGIFAAYEGSKGTVITLGKTRRALAGISGFQHDLFDQAVRSVEYGLYRSAHVMAWAALIDLIEHKLGSDGFVRLHAERQGWVSYKTVEELRENIQEYQLIEAAKAVGLITKTEMKSLHGSLSRRNESAHPSSYEPGMNESLGFISELMKRANAIQARTI